MRNRTPLMILPRTGPEISELPARDADQPLPTAACAAIWIATSACLWAALLATVLR